jgi:predicted enzyme related to lactoylglutathione lyase
MSEVATFAPGTPCWVDLSSPDIEGSKAFYTSLFGWQAKDLGPDSGGYMMFTLDGKEVAGLGGTQEPGQPPAWMVYFEAPDAEAAARKVEAAGGKVVAPPFDVMNAGRMAVFQDPTGAFFSVWQPGEMKGAEVVGQPNSFAWAELNARGVEAAKPFYTQVFGWGDKTSPASNGQPAYTEWQLGGHSIGGAMEMVPQIPAQVPSHWLVYFGSTDVDATAARVVELGGKALMAPMDFPGGRFAVVQDPQSAAFGILKLRQ